MSNKIGSPAAEQHMIISPTTPGATESYVGLFWSDSDDLTGTVYKCTQVGPVVWTQVEASLQQEKSYTIESPTGSEDLSFIFTNRAITITEMRAVVVGPTSPSVTWTVRHGTDRNATGAEVVTGGTTTTSTTSGDDVTSFNDATIVADSFVWIETTAQSGTVTSIQITIVFTID